MRRDSSSYLARFAQLGALWAYSVSQPVFSLLDGNPEFLVVRGATRAEVVVFALILAFGPAVLAVALEAVVSRFSARAADVLHLVLVGLFVVPLGMLLVQAVDPSVVGALLGAVGLSVALVVCFARWRPVRLFVTLSFALPLVGLTSFMLGTRLVTESAEGAAVRVGAKTPVVMVVFDELPTTSLMTSGGAIDRVRYPNFGRLASSATWFRRATAVHDLTTGAVPSIVTGVLPRNGELPLLADHPVNLFTLLGESYDMRVHEEVTYLCPKRYCPRARAPFVARLSGLFGDVRVAFLRSMLPASLANGLGVPEVADRWSGFENTERLLGADDQGDVNVIVANRSREDQRIADDFTAGIRRDEPAATLHFVHFTIPHTPFRYLPSGRQYEGFDHFSDVVGSGEAWHDDRSLVERNYQRHLLQVGYVDAVLGQVLDRLERAEVYDRALVVVVADHGIGFEAGVPRRPVVRENLADIARVPLFVKLPGQRDGATDNRAVRVVDVLPTIADVLELHLPSQVDGRSLLRPGVSGHDVRVRSRSGDVVAASPLSVDRQEARTLRRKSELFGDGSASLFTIGVNRELIGRAVATLRVQASNSSRVHFDGEAAFGDIRRSSPFVPVRIQGRIEGVDIDPDIELAVAINGRIAALTRISRVTAEPRFDAMVPETAFREGSNRVELFAIAGRGGAVRLTRLGSAGT
jgi:hypothetical protein